MSIKQLQLKAKTTADILRECSDKLTKPQSTEPSEQFVEQAHKLMMLYNSQKWVLLEDAEIMGQFENDKIVKLEAENTDLKLTVKRLESKLKTNTEGLAIQLTKMTNINIELSNEIAEANKILDTISFNEIFDNLKGEGWGQLAEESEEKLECLRKCLSQEQTEVSK